MDITDILLRIITPLLAACFGAILAFRYQRSTELKREKRQILQILMMYRNVGADELDWIKALNAVDIVFHDDRIIRELLHTFFAQTVPPMFGNNQYVETFYRLLFEMAQSCGYRQLTMHDIRDFYSPQALNLHYPNRNVGSEPSPPSSDVVPQSKP